jgi:hypothetical protein
MCHRDQDAVGKVAAERRVETPRYGQEIKGSWPGRCTHEVILAEVPGELQKGPREAATERGGPRLQTDSWKFVAFHLKTMLRSGCEDTGENLRRFVCRPRCVRSQPPRAQKKTEKETPQSTFPRIDEVSAANLPERPERKKQRKQPHTQLFLASMKYPQPTSQSAKKNRERNPTVNFSSHR